MTGQPSPYSDRGSAEALALAGQCGMLWRQVDRYHADLVKWRRRCLEAESKPAREAALERQVIKFHRRAQKAEGLVVSLRRQLAHIGREWRKAVGERDERGRSLATLGGILEALAERLTPEEAAAVACEMARAGGGHGG